MKTIDGRLVVVSGASRTGKTAWTRSQVEGRSRVLVWDVEDQWSTLRGFARITTRAELLSAAEARGPLRAAFVAGGDLGSAFDFFAGCASYAGRHVEPLTVVAEELADVTTPAKAPGNWGILLRRGLKRGIDIFAISQRWAEADKTALGNASEYVMFMSSSADDVRYLARKTRVPVADLDALRPLEFVRYVVATQQIEAGRLKF